MVNVARLWLLLCLGSVLLGGCLGARKQPPIRVGALLTLSGRNGFIGTPEAQTLQFLADEANARGGIHGRLLQLTIKDTKGNAERAAALAIELVEDDRVCAVIGPSTTVESL